MNSNRERIIWLRDVVGLDREHTNSVCCIRDPDRDQGQVLILFPGDIMDEESQMDREFRQVSIENVTTLLLDTDTSVGIIATIQPSQKIGQTSVFANFVSVKNNGCASSYLADGCATVCIEFIRNF